MLRLPCIALVALLVVPTALADVQDAFLVERSGCLIVAGAPPLAAAGVSDCTLRSEGRIEVSCVSGVCSVIVHVDAGFTSVYPGRSGMSVVATLASPSAETSAPVCSVSTLAGSGACGGAPGLTLALGVDGCMSLGILSQLSNQAGPSLASSAKWRLCATPNGELLQRVA